MIRQNDKTTKYYKNMPIDRHHDDNYNSLSTAAPSQGTTSHPEGEEADEHPEGEEVETPPENPEGRRRGAS
jgi:hypothetical protein